METAPVQPLKLTKTIHDMKDVIYDCIDKLRAQKMPAADVNAITNAAGKVISIHKLELDVMKLTNRKPDDNFLLGNGTK